MRKREKRREKARKGEKKREKGRKRRKREEKREKDRNREKKREKRGKYVQGQLLSICIQFAKRKTKYIGRNAQNLKSTLSL